MIVAYIRVSTEEQAKSGLGLDDQQKTVGETAARIGIAVRATVIDDGETAGKDVNRRPKLQEAIGLLKKGDILLAVKRDRLSRGDPVAMSMIERQVARKKARVMSAAGEGTERQTSGAVFERRMHDAFAEHELGVIGERTSAALQAKRRRGELAGAAPYGWRSEVDLAMKPTKRGRPGQRLVPIENEQKALVIMKECRAQGFSLRDVARELARHGFQPKGKKWHAETIRVILGEDRKPC